MIIQPSKNKMFVFIFVLYIIYLQFSLGLQQFFKIYTALQSFFSLKFQVHSFYFEHLTNLCSVNHLNIERKKVQLQIYQ